MSEPSMAGPAAKDLKKHKAGIMKGTPIWLLVICAALRCVSTGFAQERERSVDIRPFKIRVDDAALKDLKQRLSRARFSDQIDDSGWDYGVDRACLKELMDYWRTKYDWRKWESKLNEFDQFQTAIDGLDIHFIHVR